MHNNQLTHTQVAQVISEYRAALDEEILGADTADKLTLDFARAIHMDIYPYSVRPDGEQEMVDIHVTR